MPSFPYSFWTATSPGNILLNLYAYYTCEDGFNPGFDNSLNGNTLSNSGLDQAQGKISWGYWNSQSTNLFTNAGNAFSHTGNKTFAIWMTYFSLNAGIVGSGKGPYIYKGDASNIEYRLYRVDGSNNLTWSIWDSTAAAEVTVTHPYALSVGDGSASTFHLVICWIDTSLKTIYLQVDNQSVVSTTYQNTRTLNNTDFRLLGDSAGVFDNSGIDEIGCWNRILTPQERLSLWNNGSGKTYPF